MSNVIQELHDTLLKGQPEGVVHNASDCPLCSLAPETANAQTTSTGGNVSEKTYTEAEYTQLAGQVTSLEAQIAELTKAAEAEAIDARIAEAKAELESQVADLQSQLDTAVLEKEAARTELDNVTSYLAAEAAAAEQAAEAEARRDERIAAVKEVASFPDEYLEANADRFVAMSEEQFEAALQDWKTIAPKSTSSTTSVEELVPETAMSAGGRTTNTNPDKTLLREVFNLRDRGVDVRTI